MSPSRGLLDTLPTPAVVCPEVAALLAAVAGHGEAEALDHHLDGCAGCRDKVRAAREAAGEDPGCDVIETLLAELDDGEQLPVTDHARILVHFTACDSCRGGSEPLDTAVPAATGDAPGSVLPVVPRSTYDVEHEIARGGMGRILRAVDRRLGRAVALKEVLPSGERSFAEARLWNARLEREAKITARLNHPSIVSVHEAGLWPRGTPFFAMDLVAGRSLDRVVAEARTQAERLALLPHAIAVADALAYAHGQGVIHRDLKPANVLVGNFGETVVIDWGLAADLGDPDDLYERGVVGTPAYMPPEQAAGERVDRRADVYALGAMLHHLLAGRPPRGPLPKGVPAALATIVARAMSARPEDRFPSAAEMAEELRRFQTGRLVQAHEYGLGGLVRHWLAHRRVSVTLAVALGVALIATGATGLSRVLVERDRVAAFNERLIAARARELVAQDPTAAMAWLARASLGDASWLDARAVAAEAEAAGVAAHVLPGHRAAVTWVATRGALAISGAHDGELRVWDLEHGTARRLGNHGGAVHEMALSSDGATLAVAGAAGLQLWDVAHGVPRPLPGHRGEVYTVGFTAGDREVVSGGQDGTVWRFPRAGGSGRRVFGADDASRPLRTLHTLRAAQPDARHVLTYHAVRRDLTIISSADGQIIRSSSHQMTWSVAHPGGAPVFAALSPREDELATVGRDGEIRRFELERGTFTSLGRAADVSRLEYSPDGRRLAAATRAPALRVWDLATGAERLLEGHTLQTYGVAWSRDGALLASAGHDGTVRVWDPEQGELWTLRGHRAPVQWVAFGADRSLLSLSLDGTARVWRPSSRATRALPRHEDAVYAVGFAGGSAFTAGLDGRLRLWDAATWSHRDLVHPAGVWRAWLAPGGGHALTSDAEGVCRLWDVARGEATVVGEPGVCRDRGGFSASGARFFTLDRGGALRLWSIADPRAPLETRDAAGAAFAGETLLHLERGPRSVMTAWSADGGTRAVAEPDAIVILDVASGRTTRLVRPDVAFADLRLSPDGRRLAIGDLGGRVYVYDTRSGAREVLCGHTGGVVAVALASDARWLASASQGELFLWDLETGRRRALHGHAEWINDLAFSPDGRRLLSAGTDGSVRLWSAELEGEVPASPQALVRRIAEATSARLDGHDQLVR